MKKIAKDRYEFIQYFVLEGIASLKNKEKKILMFLYKPKFYKNACT